MGVDEILTPSLGSQYPDMLYYLKGRRFSSRRNKDFSNVGVSAINDHELRVELKNPTIFY